MKVRNCFGTPRWVGGPGKAGMEKERKKDQPEETKTVPKRKKSQRVSNLILVGILILGICIAGYPTFSDYLNSLRQSRAIKVYEERVAEFSNEEYKRIWDAAIDFNRRLPEKENRWVVTEEDTEEYGRQLNVDATGNMGSISIPKINVNLPIYHGTSDDVLQTAIGHVWGTSLPVGSVHSDPADYEACDFASHSVLSGHRGLPSARLFTDLDAMEIGDLFYLTILEQTLTYRVDQITVIEPEDMTELEIVPGRDLCTLMTCTPYGVNTHRLLVRGTRVQTNACE